MVECEHIICKEKLKNLIVVLILYNATKIKITSATTGSSNNKDRQKNVSFLIIKKNYYSNNAIFLFHIQLYRIEIYKYRNSRERI